MADRDDETRRAIDESLAPRILDQETYLASAASPHLPIACAGMIYLWDEHHHRLLDFSSGGAVMNMGHLNDAVKAVIREHLDHYDHPSSRQGEHVVRFPVEYARAISETFPLVHDQPQRVLYALGEAEALDAAQDLARQVSEVDPLVLTLLSPAGELLDAREAAALAAETRARGGLVIVDETWTGFGRTGTLWAQEQWGITADITVLGAAGGGGFPFAAVVAPSACFSSYVPTVSPQAGHPIICAAGKVMLNQLSPILLEHVKELGHILTDMGEELVAQFPETVKGVRGIGLLQWLEQADHQTALRFRIAALEVGLMMSTPDPGSPLLPLTPAFIMSENELRRGIDLLAEVCLSWREKRNP
jgi:4-aminobutyrate aminotransferase-like enzyme